MIQLTCANCKSALEVDDAFAGGVCRCQYCGTIQTVPKAGARPIAPGSAVRQTAGVGDEPRALYQVKARTGLSSAPSGLEELAEAVHSSGLSGSGLLNRSPRYPTTSTPAQQKKSSQTTLIAFAVGFGVVALIAVVILIVVFSKSASPSTEVLSDSPAGSSNVPTTPAFFNTQLSSDRVAYIIDRGDATATFFPAIKKLTVRSVQSLGGDRKFCVILWNNGTDDAYPRSGTAYAGETETRKLAKWFDDISTGQATTVDSAMKNALLQSPGEIVLVTGKSDQLDSDTFASEVLELRGAKNIKIHTFTLGDSPAGDPLKKIALETKGTFAHLTREQLFNLPE